MLCSPRSSSRSTHVIFGSFQLETVNANKIDAGCDNLFVGEVSCFIAFIPQLLTGVSLQPLCLGIVGQDCDITHVVQPGDNCDTIAQQAKTTRQILLANNPNVNTACTNINLGEVGPRESCIETYSLF